MTFVHVVAAMVWVGGGFVLVLVERNAWRRGGEASLVRTMDDLEWLDNWVFTPAPLLAIGTGVAMVTMSEAWSFSQPWVYLAMGLILIEFVFGYRDLRRLKEAREQGVDSLQFGQALRSYLRMAPMAIALLIGVVALMVFKPGV